MSLIPSMDSKTTPPLFPSPLPLESNMNTNENSGSHAPGIRKAMKILEAEFSDSNVSSSQSVVVTTDAAVGVHLKKKNVDDGKTHSLPHKKYGPYTCPKCYQVLATSQKFASHVTSNHYKFDSPEERKKRYISKINKKSDRDTPKLDN